MSGDKSKQIQFLAGELGNLDKGIEAAKKLDELPLATLHIYNGSCERIEIQIPNKLKKTLKEFLLNHFYDEKEEIFNQIKEIN
nr:hypothetical protein [uncultured Draconibacterium sp.]